MESRRKRGRPRLCVPGARDLREDGLLPPPASRRRAEGAHGSGHGCYTTADEMRTSGSHRPNRLGAARSGSVLLLTRPSSLMNTRRGRAAPPRCGSSRRRAWCRRGRTPGTGRTIPPSDALEARGVRVHEPGGEGAARWVGWLDEKMMAGREDDLPGVRVHECPRPPRCACSRRASRAGPRPECGGSRAGFHPAPGVAEGPRGLRSRRDSHGWPPILADSGDALADARRAPPVGERGTFPSIGCTADAASPGGSTDRRVGRSAGMRVASIPDQPSDAEQA